MINNDQPYMVLTDKSLNSTDSLIMQERSLKDLNKITFYFQDWQMKHQTDYHKYVCFTAENRLKIVNSTTGKSKYEIYKTNMRICGKDDFQSSDFLKKSWDNYWYKTT